MTVRRLTVRRAVKSSRGMIASGWRLKALNRCVTRPIIGSHVLNALVPFAVEADGDIVFAVDLDSELLG